jgi:hypothetical protein
MPNYTVNGKSYFFGTEIGQEAAEAKVKELFGGGGSKGEDKYSYENPEDEGVLQEITEGSWFWFNSYTSRYSVN